MSYPGIPSPHAGNLPPNPHANALDLDGDKMRVLAYQVENEGLSRDQLLKIYYIQMATDNPLLSPFMDSIGRSVEYQDGGDLASFNRGAALAYFLIDRSSKDGAPVMDPNGLTNAAKHVDRAPSLKELWRASDKLINSQPDFNQAFSQGIHGLPEETQFTMARLGGGIMLLSEMSSTELGAKAAEMWFDPTFRGV